MKSLTRMDNFQVPQLINRLAAVAVLIVGLGACSGSGEINFGSDTVDSKATLVDSQIRTKKLEAKDSTETVESCDLDGVSVYSDTVSGAIPIVASKVEFTGTIIDSGDGPEICFGGVAESLPPQCSGPVAIDLEMNDWAETVSGVSFGDRTVVVSWPPQDNKVTLISDQLPNNKVSVVEDMFPLPADCKNLVSHKTVDIEVLSKWADANPQIAGIAYFSRNVNAVQEISKEEGVEKEAQEEIQEQAGSSGIGVLQVVKGKAEDVRKALTDGDKVPCLAEVEHSMQDLIAARAQLEKSTPGEGVYMTGNSIGGVSNKLNVGVAVADVSTINNIADALNNKSLLEVVGSARIVE